MMVAAMDSVRLIASDMDGTLLNGRGELDPDFFIVFEQLQRQLDSPADELSKENSIEKFGAALKNHEEYEKIKEMMTITA